MIELNDTIRAVEKFMAPEGAPGPDPSSSAVGGEGSKLQNDVVPAEPSTDSHKTYSFGDFPVNMD